MMMEQNVAQSLGLTEEAFMKIAGVLGREPNVTELGMFGVMYSEHCSYASSKPVLKVFPTEGSRLLVRAGEGDAGVIDIGEGLALVFKIESHNHPSAVEPFQGAATGVGGIIRDVFTMGARPIALLNSLRFGRLESPRTQQLVRGVVGGIGFYGNVMGIPTVGGEVVFDETYDGNPLVNAMCVGVMKAEELTRARAEGEHNPVFYVGATTGRDGLGGASFASRDLSEASSADRPAVQVGDPFLEKLLLEACLELIQEGVVVSMKDMGAAGLVCSTSESAAAGGVGMKIDLEKVPRRAQGMTPYEILLSESQERMLLVIRKGEEQRARRIFEKWDLEAVEIGRVTDGDRFLVMNGSEVAADVPVSLLTRGAPVYEREAREVPQPVLSDEERRKLPQPRDWGAVLDRLLDSPTIASKRWVWEQYDHMVRTNTVVPPGADAAVLRLKGTRMALAVTCDGSGRYTALDPYRGGLLAVAESYRNLAACGAEPLAITNGLNFGNPQKPEVFWQFKRCVEGMAEACRVLETPVTGGNVSFYNENPAGAVDPTPIVGMVGILRDADRILTTGFKEQGDVVLLVGHLRDEIGASEYLKVIFGRKLGPVPMVNLPEEKALGSLMLDLAGRGLVRSSHDLSEGGLAVALAECAIKSSEGVGVKIEAGHWTQGLGWDALLFGEGAGRMLLTAKQEHEKEVLEAASRHGLPARRIGICHGREILIERVLQRSVEEMRHLYEGAFTRRLGETHVR
ncbi:MAG: phosphoribosylformylglycinamidine synthase subunit PurL [Candidatus Omnitrophica bacterium]|nr:phosphoribosylformylglycinamidine synthase subunit PurL [Candidatus Omnitrophota bacterium]